MMRALRGATLFLFVFLLSVSYAYAAVYINEVNAKSPEWVEIRSTEALDLSQWTIKDNGTNNPDTIKCWDIAGCNLQTSVEYFLILGRSVNITDITSEPVTYFYTDDQSIGSGLNDDGDVVDFTGTSTATYTYSSSKAGESWSRLNDGTYVSCVPTPGKANGCEPAAPPAPPPPAPSQTQTQEQATTQTPPADTTQPSQSGQRACSVYIDVDVPDSVKTGEMFSYAIKFTDKDSGCGLYDKAVSAKEWIEDAGGSIVKQAGTVTNVFSCSSATQRSWLAEDAGSYVAKVAIQSYSCSDGNLLDNSDEEGFLAESLDADGEEDESETVEESAPQAIDVTGAVTIAQQPAEKKKGLFELIAEAIGNFFGAIGGLFTGTK